MDFSFLKTQFKFLGFFLKRKTQFQIEFFAFIKLEDRDFPALGYALKGRPRAGGFRPMVETVYLRRQIDPPSRRLVGSRAGLGQGMAQIGEAIWPKSDHFLSFWLKIWSKLGQFSDSKMTSFGHFEGSRTRL